MEYLKVGKFEIPYELYKSSKAKRVSITIKRSRVRVAVPTGFTFDYARNFLEVNKAWVLKHYQKQSPAAEGACFAPRNYLSGEKFLYRGRLYPLVIEEVSGANYYTIFQGSRIYVYVPPNLPPAEQALLVRNLLCKWYLNQAEKVLPEQVDYYAKRLAISYNKLKVKNQKTRWGSCSSKGNINLNWRIIMAPNQVIAYVIIHELCHLRFMNHSQEFWDIVANYLPDYKEWKAWLKINGNLLLLT